MNLATGVPIVVELNRLVASVAPAHNADITVNAAFDGGLRATVLIVLQIILAGLSGLRIKYSSMMRQLSKFR